MSETKNHAKLRTEPVVEHVIAGVQRLSQLSEASLAHLEHRLKGLSRQAKTKRDLGHAHLLDSHASLVADYRQACEWEHAPHPERDIAPQPPPARRVRWPEGSGS